MQDEKILELFYERNEAAITETKNKYGARLYKTALNILQSREDAEECVSDTLYKAWEAIPPAYPALLGAYMAKITRNTALHKLEKKQAAKRGGGTLSILISELETELEDCAGTTRPEKIMEANHVTASINTWLTGLDKPAKAAFVLRYFHGESIKDISERFQISESKVKSMLFRSRKKLKSHLDKEGILI